MVAQAIGAAGNPAQYLIAQQLSRVARRRSPPTPTSWCSCPYEASGVLASLGGIRELLNGSRLRRIASQPATRWPATCDMGSTRRALAALRMITAARCRMRRRRAAGSRARDPARAGRPTRAQTIANLRYHARVRYSRAADEPIAGTRDDPLHRDRPSRARWCSTSRRAQTHLTSVTRSAASRRRSARSTATSSFPPTELGAPARTRSTSRSARATRRSTATPTSCTRSSCRRARTWRSPASTSPI